MDAFLDLFSLKRREGDRVYIDWLVDIPVPGQDSFIAFFGRDISTGGMRLEGASLDRVEQITSSGKHTRLSIRVPNVGRVIEVDAELKWGPVGEDKPQTGWEFTRLGREERRFIENYIDAHIDDLVKSEDQGNGTE
jgi:hypothetical protein